MLFRSVSQSRYQAAEKKKKADKEAGERLKKIKKQELKIALATQLANIGVAAAQNPLNGVTFGAAGIAMYAVLAGLALAQYAMNLGALNNTQFAKGGIFKRFFARGWRNERKVDCRIESTEGFILLYFD